MTYNYKKPNLKGESYDDRILKKKLIEISDQILGFKIKVNNDDNGKGIDLISINDPDVGIEGERGKWIGDFWANDSYCKISGLDFPTVNAPHRKLKYWLEYYQWYGKEKHNPSWDKNIFIRTNIDFTQIIVVRPEVITNPNKLIKTRFKPNNSNEIEDWISFRREDAETYNLINGKYILETEPNGQYPLLTEEERNRLSRKRAALIYKESKKNELQKSVH